MRLRLWFCASFFMLLVSLAVLAADQPAVPENDTGITWKRTVIDKVFRSEGVTVADVKKRGKLDILNGEMWYEAPDWKPHEIRKPIDYGDGLGRYSNSFCCWATDLNGDGYPDLIVIGFPGNPCYWYENPKGGDGHWTPHEIWHSACNETPQYVDLFGTGKKVLVMGWQPKGKDNEGQMAWFAPGADPTMPWEMHPISPPSEPGKPVLGTHKFSHGLGIGDINGDGRLDVICTAGWWEQPVKADLDKPWKFHPANLGADCADMYVADLYGDGKAAVLSSSAHKYGIWAYQQKPGTGDPTFVRQILFEKLVSETHAMNYVDIDGDGLKDLITGKRWWSHGKSEPGSDGPAMIYWLQARKRDGVTTFIPRVIDDDSGIGTQFYVGDVNGDGYPDVVTSNKKGTYLFEQVRKPK